jgi:hypothetical protein
MGFLCSICGQSTAFVMLRWGRLTCTNNSAFLFGAAGPPRSSGASLQRVLPIPYGYSGLTLGFPYLSTAHTTTIHLPSPRYPGERGRG